jgi:hypothetical protein
VARTSSRHGSRTGQTAQMRFAARPVWPGRGKKRLRSASRQAARGHSVVRRPGAVAGSGLATSRTPALACNVTSSDPASEAHRVRRPRATSSVCFALSNNIPCRWWHIPPDSPECQQNVRESVEGCGERAECNAPPSEVAARASSKRAASAPRDHRAAADQRRWGSGGLPWRIRRAGLRRSSRAPLSPRRRAALRRRASRRSWCRSRSPRGRGVAARRRTSRR